MDNLLPTSIYQALPSTSVTNAEYLFWHPYWVTIRDCLMGEIAIKRRRTTYLPKMSTQEDEEYLAHLQRACFYNATELTVKSLVGAVHIREPIIDNLPDSLDLMSVTNDGQTFINFSKRITRELVSIGRYGVLIDAPDSTEAGTPYFAGYQAEDIIDWSTVRIRGRDHLRRVILREFVRVDDETSDFPLDSKLVESFRVLYLGSDGVYRQRYYPEGDLQGQNYQEYVPLKQGIPLNHIPFYFFGPSDFAPDIEKPPILDIALMNLSHYRSYAELESGRCYTAMPIWAVTSAGGADDDAQFKLGPNTVWQLGQGDKAELIEFRGSGLQYLENAINIKEQQIKALGGKLGQANKGMAAESAESVISRERGEASLLQSVISIMSSGMTILMNELATWVGEKQPNIKIKFTTEAMDMYMSAREIRAIQSLWESGMLPIEVIYAVFRDANILPPTMSINEFRDALPKMSYKTEQNIIQAREEAKIAQQYAVPRAKTAVQTQAPQTTDSTAP